MDNGAKFCAVKNAGGTDCEYTGWDPNTQMFTIVAGGSGALSGCPEPGRLDGRRRRQQHAALEQRAVPGCALRDQRDPAGEQLEGRTAR